jgi:hypothetical protein
MDINSLRFGAPEVVNYGRGCSVIKTEKSGKDLIVTFDGAGNGITDKNFSAKLLGRTSDGDLLFGYARLPWLNDLEPALSARMPVFTLDDKGYGIETEVQNFGQVASLPALIKIYYSVSGQMMELASGTVPSLNPFQKTKVQMNCGKVMEPGIEYDINVSIFPEKQEPVLFHSKIKFQD